MEALIPILLENGLPGIVILVLGYAYRQERAKVDRLYERDSERASEMTRAVIALEGITRAVGGKA